MAASRRKLDPKVIIIAVVATIALGTLVPLVIYNVAGGPPGPPLATIDIRSGEPFELRFTSDGRAPRVFVDMDCDSCSYPLTGKMSLHAGARELFANEISAGDTRDRAWGGTSRQLVQHPLFSVSEQPAGTELILRGTLIVGPARGTFSTTPVKGAPPPVIKVLRVTVAP